MSQTYSVSNSKSGQRQTANNFLEALRDLGKDIVTETKDQLIGTQPAPDHRSGQLSPNEAFSLGKPVEQTFRQNESRASFQLSQLREEEQARVRRQETELRQEIKAIQEEIRSLAKTMGDFAAEVEIAATQAVVNPGVYHKNFFHRLKSVISLLRKRAHDSQNWLAEFNHRASKKGHYWGQVQKSGSKYMLSSERYAVTSTG